MLKAQSITNQRGFSPVEVLLAATIFGMLVTAIVGAIIYGGSSTAGAGERARAAFLAEEGLEAVRNIRDHSYANLTNGTYGLVQSGNTWTLSGSSDADGIFTRSVTIADGGTNRKNVTANVNWASGSTTAQSSVMTRLANWQSVIAVVKSWANPTQASFEDITATIAGLKVATQGSYAYLVRSSGSPNFFVLNVSDTTNPVVVGSATIGGGLRDLSVSGNYAYVTSSSNNGELYIVNVATPATPSLASTYNASGTGDGRVVTVVGNTAYLVRAANAGVDEFVIVNVTNPAAPVRLGGFGLTANMNDVFVSGSYAYIATSSDTQEVAVVNISNPASLTFGTSINLSGTTDAVHIIGNGTSKALYITQGTNLITASFATAAVPATSGTLAIGRTINDVTLDEARNSLLLGTTGTATFPEFQAVNVATLNAPVAQGSVNLANNVALNGVAYNATVDAVIGASAITTAEVPIFVPN